MELDGTILSWGNIDAAARIAVVVFADVEKGNREYTTWKWWEVSFGERKDYKVISRQFVGSLLLQFEMGNDTTKLIVAEILGKGKAEAKGESE